MILWVVIPVFALLFGAMSLSQILIQDEEIDSCVEK